MKMNQKRKPIKVNAPAPVKNGKNIGERVAKEKPLIARRLIGNSSNSNENGAKSLSFNSKSASPAASFRGARASGSKTDGKRNESPSHRCKLLELTNERHLSRPVYQSYTTTSKHRSVAIYLSRVTVDGQYWSSHPTAVSSPDDAEELAAKKAYVELSRRWSRRQLGDNLHTQSSVERKALIDQIVSVCLID